MTVQLLCVSRDSRRRRRICFWHSSTELAMALSATLFSPLMQIESRKKHLILGEMACGSASAVQVPDNIKPSRWPDVDRLVGSSW